MMLPKNKNQLESKLIELGEWFGSTLYPLVDEIIGRLADDQETVLRAAYTFKESDEAIAVILDIPEYEVAPLKRQAMDAVYKKLCEAGFDDLFDSEDYITELDLLLRFVGDYELQEIESLNTPSEEADKENKEPRIFTPYPLAASTQQEESEWEKSFKLDHPQLLFIIHKTEYGEIVVYIETDCLENPEQKTITFDLFNTIKKETKKVEITLQPVTKDLYAGRRSLGKLNIKQDNIELKNVKFLDSVD